MVGSRDGRVRRRGLAAAWGACALLAAGLALADARSGVLAVSVTVVPSARADVVASQAMLEVTAEDIRRGYVEVHDAARLKITSNAGYRVDLHPRVALFRAAEVRVGGLRARIGPDGGSLVSAGRKGRAPPVAVDYRFELVDGVTPGRYPWPVAIDVRPL